MDSNLPPPPTSESVHKGPNFMHVSLYTAVLASLWFRTSDPPGKEVELNRLSLTSGLGTRGHRFAQRYANTFVRTEFRHSRLRCRTGVQCNARPPVCNYSHTKHRETEVTLESHLSRCPLHVRGCCRFRFRSTSTLALCAFVQVAMSSM